MMGHAMNDRLIRLECLRLAVKAGHYGAEVLNTALAFEHFVHDGVIVEVSDGDDEIGDCEGEA